MRPKNKNLRGGIVLKIYDNRWLFRIVSLLMIAFGILFGSTWGKSGYCFGDKALLGLGINPWSNGMQGTHYSAILGIVISFAGLLLYPFTPKKQRHTTNYFIIGVIVLLFILSITNCSF